MAISAPTPETAPFPEERQKEVRLYSETEYFTELIRDVNSTRVGDRVGIMTMSFEPSEPVVNELMERLYAAADRKVEVVMAVDAFAFLVDGNRSTVGPLWLPLPFGQDTFHRRLAALDRLAAKPSGNYGVVNKPGRYLSNPYSGRSHMKTSVVNNKVYITGANLNLTERQDMAVGFEDAPTADWLYELTNQVVESGSTNEVLGNDQIRQLDLNTRILVDSGRPQQSIILDEALRLINEADERTWASFQMFPDGRIMDSMLEAHERGLDVRPFHNHPSKNGGLPGIRERFVKWHAKSRLPSQFFEVQLHQDLETLHSKALVSEKAAIVGTHNFLDLGVKFGTPEIALLREDKAFAMTVGDLLLKQAQVLRPELIEELVPAPYGVLTAQN